MLKMRTLLVVSTIIRRHIDLFRRSSNQGRVKINAGGRRMTTTLNNGEHMPLVGYGTSQIPPDNVEECVRLALEAGYRHIDTAHYYKNEKHVGKVLQEHFCSGKLTRNDVFITSKLSIFDMKPEHVLPALEESLISLQVEILDLYLIHFPVGFEKPEYEDIIEKRIPHPVNLTDIWKEMEKLVRLGKVRSIGVSNFNSMQLDMICSVATIVPVVNQVEAHVRLAQFELQKFCESKRILLTAYAPLGSPGRRKQENGKTFMEEQIIKDLAMKHNKTPAQILLRWLVQRGITIIPKSTTKQRIEDNIQIFDFQLDKAEMSSIGTLNENQRLFRYNYMMKCPNYPFDHHF